MALALQELEDKSLQPEILERNRWEPELSKELAHALIVTVPERYSEPSKGFSSAMTPLTPRSSAPQSGLKIRPITIDTTVSTGLSPVIVSEFHKFPRPLLQPSEASQVIAVVGPLLTSPCHIKKKKSDSPKINLSNLDLALHAGTSSLFDFQHGHKVWARLKSFPPWPAKVKFVTKGLNFSIIPFTQYFLTTFTIYFLVFSPLLRYI